jgi:hypothetical protein
MGSFSELSVGDVLRAVGRYRPVVVSVLAILVALALLPKPDRPPGLASTGLGGSGISTPTAGGGAAGAVSPPAGAEAAPVDGAVTFAPGSSFTTPTSFASSGSSFSSSPSSSSSFDSDSSSGAEPSASIGPVTSGTSTVDTTNGSVTEQPKPLQVVGKLWAGRTGGTPVAKDGVPEGTLPVGVRVTDDRISFVRLAGDGTSLGFASEASGTRETSGPIKVQACKATAKWADAEAVPLREAPTYDEARCVQGTASASGVWLFDLSSFSDRTDEFGFALVPGDGAGIEWQVAFRL